MEQVLKFYLPSIYPCSATYPPIPPTPPAPPTPVPTPAPPSIPTPFLPRIMDCFLSEGLETIFRIALTLLLMGKHELLLLDMEGVIKYFQKEMPKK